MYNSAMGNNGSVVSNEARWGKPEFGNTQGLEGGPAKSFSPIELDLRPAFEEFGAQLKEAMKPFDRLPNSVQNQEAKESLVDLYAVAEQMCDKENTEGNGFRPETPAVSAGTLSVTSDDVEKTANAVRSFGM